MADHHGEGARGKDGSVVERPERDGRRDHAEGQPCPCRRPFEHLEEHEEAERKEPEQLQLRMAPVRECEPAEGERERRQDRGVVAPGEPLREQIGRHLCQHHEKQNGEVQRGHEAARDSVEQREERCGGEHEVRVGQRVAARPEHRRVEQLARMGQECVDVPRHDPGHQRRVARVGRHRVEDGVGRRSTHEEHGAHEQHAEQHGLEPPGAVAGGRERRRRDLGGSFVGVEAGDAQRARCRGPNEYRTMQ